MVLDGYFHNSIRLHSEHFKVLLHIFECEFDKIFTAIMRIQNPLNFMTAVSIGARICLLRSPNEGLLGKVTIGYVSGEVPGGPL